MKNALITCIVGGYDWLKDPVVVTAGWDYLCFSDRGLGSAIWQARPLPELPVGPDDPKRYSSLFKILHHRFIDAEYDTCITIDGSMTVNACLDRFLGEFRPGEADLVLARHPDRKCVFDEAEAVIGFHLDDPAVVRAQMRRYAAGGMPAAAGLFGTRVMAKKNRSAPLRALCEDWGDEVQHGSRRDQLALPYVLWRWKRDGREPVDVAAFDFEDVFRRRKLFTISQHLGSPIHWTTFAPAALPADAPAPRRVIRRTPRWMAGPIMACADSRLRKRLGPYLAARFRPAVGYDPQLAVPRRYHEKMMWRKVFDRNPLFVAFCDKLATKSYIASRIPGFPVPETLWVGTDFREIPPSILAERVVIKAAHGCSQNHFWDPRTADRGELALITDGWLHLTHGQGDLEWAYGPVAKRIFVERNVAPSGSVRPVDISIRCTDGRPILASVKTDNKTPAQKIGYFSLDGRRVFLEQGNDLGPAWGVLPADYVPPRSLSRAVEAAARLSRGVDFARYDFMTDGCELYAGEIVVYPNSGLSRAGDESTGTPHTLVAAHWDLRKSWFLREPQPGRLGIYADLLHTVLGDSRQE